MFLYEVPVAVGRKKMMELVMTDNEVREALKDTNAEIRHLEARLKVMRATRFELESWLQLGRGQAHDGHLGAKREE